MASVGKKKDKQKWTPVKTDAIITTVRKPTTTWAEESEELDGFHSYESRPQKVELPTAPRASRGTAVDETKIPHSGPFQAYLSNIPYDVNEDEVVKLFDHLQVKEVNLPKEEKTMKARGFAYIEFENRADLVQALGIGDTMLKGRVIKIDLPHNSETGGRGRGGRGPRDMGRDQNSSSDRTSGNWRSGPRQDDFDDRSYDRDRGYGGRRDYGERSGGGGGSGYSRGGFDREERGFYRDDRERGSSGGGGAGAGAGGGSSSSSGHWRDEPRENRSFGGGRGGYEDRRDRDRDSSKFGPPRRDDLPLERGGNPGVGAGESRNRPKLQLQPRTKPKENSSDSVSASASIFGGAKPVDTAAREREIEKRLMKNAEYSDSRSSKSGPGSSGSRENAVEPAPPPKENAWSRKGPQINNGCTSPDDDGTHSNIDSDDRSQDDPRSRRTIENEWKA